MTSIQKVSVLGGFAATAALLGAVPVQASELALTQSDFNFDAELTTQSLTVEELAAGSLDEIQFANQPLTVDAEVLVLSEAVTPDEQELSVQLEDEPETGAVELAETAEEAPTVEDVAAATSDALLLDSENALTLPEAESTVAQSTEGSEVAQVTAPLYRGIAPVYIGIGGNIGIGDSAKSGVGDFGFTVFGKFSLGPRFAVRPALIISEDQTSVTVPITFNFTPIRVAGYTMAPFIGGGVDISDTVGALINAGVDIPISQQFTLTAQGNFRVSDDSAFGIYLGGAYNIPFFLE